MPVRAHAPQSRLRPPARQCHKARIPTPWDSNPTSRTHASPAALLICDFGWRGETWPRDLPCINMRARAWDACAYKATVPREDQARVMFAAYDSLSSVSQFSAKPRFPTISFASPPSHPTPFRSRCVCNAIGPRVTLCPLLGRGNFCTRSCSFLATRRSAGFGSCAGVVVPSPRFQTEGLFSSAPELSVGPRGARPPCCRASSP